MIKISFLGVRGSRPTHKINLLGYGGHSTSMKFDVGDENFGLFLDGGSGLAHDRSSQNHQSYHFLVTHTHWDHIIGYPFFAPFYDKTKEVHFYISSNAYETFQKLFLNSSAQNHLPIPKDKIDMTRFHFHEIGTDAEFCLKNDTFIQAFPLNHQNVTLAYRLDRENHSVAIITDHAPLDGGNYLSHTMKDQTPSLDFEEKYKKNMIHFLNECHTVVFDSHFNLENIKPDWGHSTFQEALSVCLPAKVKRLFLFHHAPEDTDKKIHEKVQEARRLAGEQIEILGAKEGESWICG